MFPQSYRAKLVIYITILMMLLASSSLYTYSYVHALLEQENNNHVASLAQVLQSRMEANKT